MNVIRNLKDPTMVAELLPLLLLVCTFGSLLLGTQVTADTVAEGVAANVSCISHDTKFTCDCRNENQHMVLPPLAGYVFQVEVRNCKSLTVNANTLEGTQGLRKISFNKVEKLVLNKYALAFPRYASNTPLIVEFLQVNFELIDSHAINGNIEEISFINGKIEVINPFGFTTLKERALLLKMDHMLVKTIEPQAFKKFAVEEMEITNCVFDTNMPSKAFYELEVLNTLRISNVQFKEVHSRAFSFQMISKLSISNNYFQAADAEWIEAHLLETAVLRENDFGVTSEISFKGLYVHRNYISSEPLELQFTNNTVRFPQEPRPLEFNPRFRLTLKQLMYDQEYPCDNLDTTQNPPQPKTVFFQLHIDSIYFHRPAGGSSSSTAGNNQNQSFVVLSKIIEVDCQQSKHLLFILIGVIILAIILMSVVVFMTVYLRHKKRKRRKMDVVLPEPRTYKETQIVYQIENAGLLKTDL